MKKICIALMVLMLVTGCSSNSVNLDKLSPEEQYQVVQEKMQELTSAETKISVDLKMEYNGEVSSETYSMTMKMADMDKQEKLSAQITTSVEGYDMDMFFKDGYLYFEMMGIKIKSKMTDDIMSSYIEEYTNQSNIEDEMLIDIKSEKVGDDYVLSFKMSDEEINDLINTYLGSLVEEIGDVKTDISINSVTITADKDAHIKEQNVEMGIVIEVDGEKMELNLVTSVEYSNLNKTKIDFPKDLDEYKEY